MVTSVNTNPGALKALQNLNQTSRELSEVQSRINTGMKVASAKDNGAVFAIAQNMRADLSGLSSVKQSLDRGISTVDVALNAGEQVSDLLNQMKEKAVAATDSSLDADSKEALNQDFVALRDQISNIVDNAEFNGTNMLKNGGDDVTALVSDDGTQTITVAAQDLSLTGSTLAISGSSTITSGASTVVSNLESSISNVNNALAQLGTGSKKLESQKTFVNKLSDTIETGVGNLVDADLAKESARLQSLQVKQQLGTQALSIANQAPQTVLSLFG